MKKTIALVYTTRPSSYGGAETYQLALAKELKHHGYCPIIVTSSEQLLQNSRQAGFTTIKAPFSKIQNWSGWRNLLLPLYILWQARLYFFYRRLFRKYQPAAVNIESRDDFIAGTYAAKRQGIKTFWTDHSGFRVWILTNVNAKFKNFIGKWILRVAHQADKIIFVSDYERHFFKKLTAKHHYQNLITIKNGSVDQFAHYQKVKSSPHSICYLGRIAEEKGIKELIPAFQAAHVQVPAVTLDVYGTGDQDLISKLKATDGVIYHGFTNTPLEAIAKSTIFVLPSYNEGLSLSLLDAAMLGRAVVATNVDGTPEVIIDGSTGLLVPAKNADALAASLIKLLKDPALQKTLSKNLRAHYTKNFDFTKIIAEQFIPLIKD